jgi:hypothetical protein
VSRTARKHYFDALDLHRPFRQVSPLDGPGSPLAAFGFLNQDGKDLGSARSLSSARAAPPGAGFHGINASYQQSANSPGPKAANSAFQRCVRLLQGPPRRTSQSPSTDLTINFREKHCEFN